MEVLDPMGRAPSLVADLDMRNLDLDLLTGMFSFGNMQGRIDVAVNGLELFDWKPIKFDASLVSSPGNYPAVSVRQLCKIFLLWEDQGRQPQFSAVSCIFLTNLAIQRSAGAAHYGTVSAKWAG